MGGEAGGGGGGGGGGERDIQCEKEVHSGSISPCAHTHTPTHTHRHIHTQAHTHTEAHKIPIMSPLSPKTPKQPDASKKEQDKELTTYPEEFCEVFILL